MSGIVEFLEARIAEDEKLAQDAIADDMEQDGGFEDAFEYLTNGGVIPGFGDAAARMIVWNTPRRVLAECAAKRNIVSVYRSLSMRQHANDAGSIQWHEADSYYVVLRTLARIYKDHPDYRQEWAT